MVMHLPRPRPWSQTAWLGCILATWPCTIIEHFHVSVSSPIKGGSWEYLPHEVVNPHEVMNYGPKPLE